MKRAVIIGGNQTGLNMARCLADVGFEVKLYEQKAKDDVAYNWTDDIDPKIFAELGIDMPDPSIYFAKKEWTFVNPKETVKLFVKNSGQENDISIWRRPLNDYLYSLAKDKAEINYETDVESLIIDGIKVLGVVVKGEKILADIVVDCSGVHSKFRETLPVEFGITKAPVSGETFMAYRGFFKPVEGVEEPKYTNKAYLLHNGEKGLSWCIYNEGMVDILIGRIDKLSQEEIDRALEALRKDNPILSTELIKCGFSSVIPIRYAISKMVADGYVLAGDSAFMTIPMMGSGVFCGMYCGKILAEVLKENDDCSIANLWNYEVKFFKKFAGYPGIDALKRMLLKMQPEDIDFLFESGVMNEELLASSMGSSNGLPLSLILKMAWKGKKRLGLLLKIASEMGKSGSLQKLIDSIPEKYDEKAVETWIANLDATFNE